jgi:hypothetical protein
MWEELAKVVPTDPVFVAYLFGIVSLIFLRPEITERLFLGFVKADRGSWTHPPKPRFISLLCDLSDCFLAVASVYYLFTQRHNHIGETARDYYFSIEILFFVLCFFKYWWRKLTFNFFRHKAGIVVGIITVVLTLGIVLTLVILLGIRSAWLAMGFMLPVLAFFVMALVWGGHIARVHWGGAPKREKMNK